MKPFNKIFIITILASLTACITEDPGALQQGEKEFSVNDFDRLQIGSAFRINVVQGAFKISATGDRRNLDDLRVRKVDGTLKIDFDNHLNRKHETYLNISMPSLRAANFSGASDSNIAGFSQAAFDFTLSGASTARVDFNADEMNINVSGASYLRIQGTTSNLDAEISGASVLSAYELAANNAHVHASGASDAKVQVSEELHADASGASNISYHGSPSVTSQTSGASSVRNEQ